MGHTEHRYIHYRAFEPAELQRDTLEKAIQLFNAEIEKNGSKSAKKAQQKLCTFEELGKEVERVAAEWEAKKRHAISKKIMGLIGKLHHYQNIIALFPSQSLFTSTFFAALKVLVTVRPGNDIVHRRRADSHRRHETTRRQRRCWLQPW
jgi:hypothetical protein